MTCLKDRSFFYILIFITMWKVKSMSFDLSESMTEEEMQDFWIELSKQEQDNYYTDSLSLSYQLLD